MDSRADAIEIIEMVQREKWFVPSEESNFGLKGSKALLNYLYNKEGKVIAGDLAVALGVSTARIATTLNLLEQKGLIVRKTDEFDKRKVYVEITEIGNKSISEHREKIIGYLAVIISKIGKEKLIEHIMLLSEIKKIIEDEQRKREEK